MQSRATNNEESVTREARIRDVVEDCLSRWAAGEEFSQQGILVAHEDLLPELADELKKIQIIAQAGGAVQLDTPAADGEPTGLDSTIARTGSTGRSRSLQIRCPHCSEPLPFETDCPFTDITCGSCGSNFSLVAESETSPPVYLDKVGDFELLSRLGLGSFGTVWKAHDSKLDRAVAIKIPRKGQLTAIEEEQFLREAQVAACLDHPNIVAVHMVGRDRDTPFIVTDLVQGTTLSEWLADVRPTFVEAARLAAKIADALDHAHQEGVIHRDLKPSNILLDQDGEPRITDFGLARREVGDVTMTIEGQVLGTPAYMSPELAAGKGHQADRRTDVYSLGVMLYQLIGGELPFRGSAQMMIHQVLTEDPPSPRRLNARVPRDLETICLKCMEKEPQARYPQAGIVAAELRRYLNGEPIVARPLGRATRLVRWCRRKPVAAALIGVLAAVALVGPLVGIRQTTLANQAAESEARALMLAKEQQAEAIRSRAQELATRAMLYIAQMNIIQNAWRDPENPDVLQARRLLEFHIPEPGQPDLRSFEWFYWWKITHAQANYLKGHQQPVNAVAISPSGQTIVSASGDSTARVWNASTGELLHTIPGEEGVGLTSVAFNFGGDGLATAASNGRIRLFKTSDWTPLKTLQEPDQTVAQVVFSPTGNELAAARMDGTVRIYDVASGKLKTEFPAHKTFTAAVTYSPDGTALASVGFDGKWKIWSLAGDQPQLRLSRTAHRGPAQAVAFSPDGKRLVTGGHDNLVMLWDANTGDLIHPFVGHEAQITVLAFAPDQSTLFSASYDRSVKVWDLTTFHLRGPLKGHAEAVLAAAIAPDGRQVVTGSLDRSVGIWDLGVSLDAPARLRAHRSQVLAVDFTSDSKYLASASSDGMLLTWDMLKRESIRTANIHEGEIRDLAISPDGKLIATAGGDDDTVKLTTLSGGRHQATLRGHEDGALTVAFSPTGERLVSGGRDGRLREWDPQTGELRHLWEPIDAVVRDIAYSHDGRVLVVGGRQLKAYDAATREVVADYGELPGEVMQIVSLADEKSSVIGFSDGSIVRWHWDPVSTSRLTFAGKHENLVNSLSLSPDGRTIASGSKDGATKLWDVATGQIKANLQRTNYLVAAVAFSPDGNLLAAVDKHDIRLWQAATAAEVTADREVR